MNLKRTSLNRGAGHELLKAAQMNNSRKRSPQLLLNCSDIRVSFQVSVVSRFDLPLGPRPWSKIEYQGIVDRYARLESESVASAAQTGGNSWLTNRWSSTFTIPALANRREEGSIFIPLNFPAMKTSV